MDIPFLVILPSNPIAPRCAPTMGIPPAQSGLAGGDRAQPDSRRGDETNAKRCLRCEGRRVRPDTIFPFVVGTRLWSRAIIEILFVLWTALALANPSFRPPRSWLLLLLAAGLGASLLSACFGVSLQRSVRSNYEPMQGMVDQAH